MADFYKFGTAAFCPIALKGVPLGFPLTEAIELDAPVSGFVAWPIPPIESCQRRIGGRQKDGDGWCSGPVALFQHPRNRIYGFFL